MPLLDHLRARDNHNPPFSATHPPQLAKHHGPSVGVIILIVLIVLIVVGVVLWVVYTQLRARRLGLPSPGWRTYVPFLPNNKRSAPASYEPTRPTGGVLGKVKNAFSGSGGEGYSGANARSARTRGALDPDQAWDTRIEDEEEDLGYRGGAGAPGRYDGAPGRYDDSAPTRGRSRSRDPHEHVPMAPYPEEHPMPSHPPAKNPFDDDVRRGSPFEQDLGHQQPPRPGTSGSERERRSVFRESLQ